MRITILSSNNGEEVAIAVNSITHTNFFILLRIQPNTKLMQANFLHPLIPECFFFFFLLFLGTSLVNV